MTSQAAAQHSLAGLRGLVFFGFPLHPPNRPGTKRADHLSEVTTPMLFLQGARDSLADLKLLRPVCAKLGSRATLHIIETADHSFHVLKSSGRNDAKVLRELAETVVSWAERVEATQSSPMIHQSTVTLFSRGSKATRSRVNKILRATAGRGDDPSRSDTLSCHPMLMLMQIMIAAASKQDRIHECMRRFLVEKVRELSV